MQLAGTLSKYSGKDRGIPQTSSDGTEAGSGVGAGAGTGDGDSRDCTFPSKCRMVASTLSMALPSLERQSS
jgi:hypothetical protein